jgi:acyl-CoA synthetase (AMP-forming)/AMP-acid ligase II
VNDPVNFGELLWRSARLTPNAVALVQGEVEARYGDLEVRVRRADALVRALGIRAGEPVLLLLPNDWRFIECLLGVVRAGGVATPLNVKLADETLRYIAGHSEARVLIVHEDLAGRAADLGVETVVRVDDGWLAGIEPAGDPEPVESDARALLMYTSGSTGVPKGVLLSHANTWWQARSTQRCYMLDEDDRALITGPLYHVNALWGSLLPALWVGASAAVMPSWTAPDMVEAVHRYRPTYTSGTPSMFTLLLDAWDAAPDRDLTSLELLVCGSAPVPEELLAALQRRLPGVDVLESYGLTEAGANVLTPRWGIHKLGSTGLPVPDVELRVVDPTDTTRDVAVDEVGELWSRSPANALGYLKQPEVTAARFLPDGWMRSGDLVRRDEQGYVFFAGRIDDMINVGGENVYPKEVETVLLQHPAVIDVAVVPAPHRVKGQAPVAWVVARDGKVSEDELKQWFLARGPAYAHPRRVFFIDRLPVGGTNKIDRKHLQEEASRRLPSGLGAVAGGGA